MYPNKLGAAVKDAKNKSRTVLARSLLSAFYHNDELLGKNFSELDKDIIGACVGMLILQYEDCIFESKFKTTQK